MKHCVFCGAPLKDSDSYCPSCGIVYDDAESIALKEAMVENDDSQAIKEAKCCDSCGALLKDGDDYCPDCGVVCGATATAPQIKKRDGQLEKSNLCALLIVVAIFIWLFAPFVNYWGQPYAVSKIITDDYGSIIWNDKSWIFICIGFGMTICLICLLLNASGVARGFAIFSVSVMGLEIVATIPKVDRLSIYFFDLWGWGFWCVLVLLLSVVVISKERNYPNCNSFT